MGSEVVAPTAYCGTRTLHLVTNLLLRYQLNYALRACRTHFIVKARTLHLVTNLVLRNQLNYALHAWPTRFIVKDVNAWPTSSLGPVLLRSRKSIHMRALPSLSLTVQVNRTSDVTLHETVPCGAGRIFYSEPDESGRICAS